ncbi:unnamed protein product, partial [marine sediment metagenome]
AGTNSMLKWIKKHCSLLIAVLVSVGFVVYMYGCEPKTLSLSTPAKQVNRQELQLELDTFISMAQLRMADLDQQEQLRSIILQNALILVQGQPYNPVGLITAIAAIYGVTQGSHNITKVVKDKRVKRKADNGTG